MEEDKSSISVSFFSPESELLLLPDGWHPQKTKKIITRNKPFKSVEKLAFLGETLNIVKQ